MNRRTLLVGILTAPALLAPTATIAKEAERESPPGAPLPLRITLCGGGYSRDDVRRLISDIATALGDTTG